MRRNSELDREPVPGVVPVISRDHGSDRSRVAWTGREGTAGARSRREQQPADPPSGRPLRVCHLASGDLWAGAEAQLTSLVAELVKVPGLTVQAILFNEGLPAERLRQTGVPVTVLPESRLSTVSLIARLARHLREPRTDLVHVHGYKQSILASLAAVLAGRPCLVRTEHGVDERLSGWAGLRMGLYRRVNRLLARRYDGLVAVSEDLAAVWRSYLRGRGPAIAVVPNGVLVPAPPDAAAVARARARLKVSPDQVLFGTLGRMVPVKGLGNLLEAAALLRGRQPRATFLVAGDGPLRAALEAQVATLGLQQSVRFLGFTPDPSGVLSALDVYVLSSLGEGVPMALLEALALGRPVVATAVGGVAELLTSGVDALLVPPGAPEALAAACERLLEDPGLRTSLGAQGRVLVDRHLSAGRMAAETYEFYCRLVGTTARDKMLA
ncbi:MAG: glycosyltransferase family 4 protein [Candidatus Rokuibacteriota bacterium]